MNYTLENKSLGEPFPVLNEKFNLCKEEIKKNLGHAIDLNQVRGECTSDKEYLEVIEKEINTESTTQQVIELLINNYTEYKYSAFSELGEFNEKQST